jgi:hypothetical protein
MPTPKIADTGVRGALVDDQLECRGVARLFDNLSTRITFRYDLGSEQVERYNPLGNGIHGLIKKSNAGVNALYPHVAVHHQNRVERRGWRVRACERDDPSRLTQLCRLLKAKPRARGFDDRRESCLGIAPELRDMGGFFDSCRTCSGKARWRRAEHGHWMASRASKKGHEQADRAIADNCHWLSSVHVAQPMENVRSHRGRFHKHRVRRMDFGSQGTNETGRDRELSRQSTRTFEANLDRVPTFLCRLHEVLTDHKLA